MNTTTTTPTVAALRIDPDGSVHLLQLTRSEGGSLGDALREQIGCRAFDVIAGDGYDVWVDDEFLYRPDEEANPAAASLTVRPVRGPIVVTGGPDATGDTTALPASALGYVLWVLGDC